MNLSDYLIIAIGVAIVLWYTGWFGTNYGERVISGFNDERFKIFVLFNVSLIIAFALLGIYFIKRMGALQ